MKTFTNMCQVNPPWHDDLSYLHPNVTSIFILISEQKKQRNCSSKIHFLKASLKMNEYELWMVLLITSERYWSDKMSDVNPLTIIKYSLNVIIKCNHSGHFSDRDTTHTKNIWCSEELEYDDEYSSKLQWMSVWQRKYDASKYKYLLKQQSPYECSGNNDINQVLV